MDINYALTAITPFFLTLHYSKRDVPVVPPKKRTKPRGST